MAEATERPIFHLSADGEFEKRYKLGRTLGQGSFATVKMAKEIETGKTWAAKIIKRAALTSEDTEALKSEMLIIQRLQHPNIVQVHEIFDSPHHCNIIMEIMSGGEMFDRIIEKEHYSEVEARTAVFQILSAIDYCHDHSVVHRDLKPENLLYSSSSDDAVLKLADFGLARVVKPHEILHNQCGTPGYVAPEVLSNMGYDSSCDLWSVGVIIFIVICGFPPFYDDDNEVLFSLIQNAQFEYLAPYWDEVGEEVKDLISNLLVADPTKRFTVKQALQHPWITNIGNHSTNRKTDTQAQLKKYNARRRFRGAIRAVQVGNLLKRLHIAAAGTPTATSE